MGSVPVNPSYRSIRRKFFLLRLMIALPAVFVGLGSYWFAQEHLTREVESRLEARAHEVARDVSDWTEEHQFNVGTVARLSTLRYMTSGRGGDTIWAGGTISPHLEAIRTVLGERYEGLAVFGLDGTFWGGRFPYADHDTVAFREACDGLIPATWRFDRDPDMQSHILVYAPIHGVDEPPTAILSATVSGAQLMALLDEEAAEDGRHLHLIDSAGNVLNEHEPASPRGSDRLWAIHNSLESVHDRGHSLARYTDTHGEEVLAAIHWIQSLGLGILAERDHGEAYGAFNRWRFVIWFVVLSVIGIGVALSSILANRTVRQLEQREQELRTTHAQLIAADRLASVGMMAASIAHEVNNPLTTIKVLIHSVHERMHRGDDLREDLGVTLGEIDKIKALILRFLQFARPSEPEFATVNLNDTLNRLVALVRPQAQGRNLSLTEDYEDALPAVWADGSQLGQVFLNLFFNAIEAADDDGDIRVTTRSAAGHAVVATIWNSGDGLDHELSERIFDPFFSTKTTGTGLGLPIARMIVSKHHGSLNAEGHGDKGTSFHVTIPQDSSGGEHAPRTGG